MPLLCLLCDTARDRHLTLGTHCLQSAAMRLEAPPLFFRRPCYQMGPTTLAAKRRDCLRMPAIACDRFGSWSNFFARRLRNRLQDDEIHHIS